MRKEIKCALLMEKWKSYNNINAFHSIPFWEENTASILWPSFLWEPVFNCGHLPFLWIALEMLLLLNPSPPEVTYKIWFRKTHTCAQKLSQLHFQYHVWRRPGADLCHPAFGPGPTRLGSRLCGLTVIYCVVQEFKRMDYTWDCQQQDALKLPVWPQSAEWSSVHKNRPVIWSLAPEAE